MLEQKNVKHLWLGVREGYKVVGFQKELNVEIGCFHMLITEQRLAHPRLSDPTRFEHIFSVCY